MHNEGKRRVETNSTLLYVNRNKKEKVKNRLITYFIELFYEK